MLRIYPSPALIILVACGIAISYASQQQQNYDPQWLAICSLLFVAGCLVSFNIMQTQILDNSMRLCSFGQLLAGKPI